MSPLTSLPWSCTLAQACRDMLSTQLHPSLPHLPSFRDMQSEQEEPELAVARALRLPFVEACWLLSSWML